MGVAGAAWKPALARFLNCSSDGGPRGQRRGHKQRSGRLRMVIDEWQLGIMRRRRYKNRGGAVEWVAIPTHQRGSRASCCACGDKDGPVDGRSVPGAPEQTQAGKGRGNCATPVPAQMFRADGAGSGVGSF